MVGEGAGLGPRGEHAGQRRAVLAEVGGDERQRRGRRQRQDEVVRWRHQRDGDDLALILHRRQVGRVGSRRTLPQPGADAEEQVVIRLMTGQEAFRPLGEVGHPIETPCSHALSLFLAAARRAR